MSSPTPRRAAAIAVGSALIVLAALTVAVVVTDSALPGEVAWIRAWQRLGRPVPALADGVRVITGTEGSLVMGAVPAIWLINRHGARGLIAVLICVVAMLVIQPASKELVDRDRPTAAEVDVRAENTSRSYPSGHSLSTTATWGTAALYAWRRRRGRLAVLLALPILVTGLSSAVQGVHWPSDAVAGTIIGALAAWLAADVALGVGRLGDPDAGGGDCADGLRPAGR